MEENKSAKIESEDLDQVAGGKGYSGGYCPYTTDRCCRLEQVGTFSNDNEICQECGWRAW